MKKQILLIALVFFLSPTNAQKKFIKLAAEIRPRILLDDGYKLPKLKNQETLAYITQRTRINIYFKKNKLESYISIQDVRFWGDDNIYKESGSYGNSNSISLHEGWFMLNLNKKISIKTGRQLFQYDDQRIISSRNWNDYQVTYDAVLLKFNDSANIIDIGMSWNSETSNTTLYSEKKFKLFDFIHYTRRIKNLNISAITALTGNTISDTSENINILGTYGLNMNYKKNDFFLRTSAYYQNNLNHNEWNINAYCFSIFGKKKLFHFLTLGAGYDYLSGQDESNLNTDYQYVNHRFNILYGRRHGWYGYMDYFSTTPDQGLQDFMIKTEYKPSKNLKVQIDYHFFKLAQYITDVDNQSIKLSKNLGQEFDFTLKWQILNEVSLQTGYSFYLMTNSLKHLKNVNNEELRFPQFAYVMVTVAPTIYKSLW